MEPRFRGVEKKPGTSAKAHSRSCVGPPSLPQSCSPQAPRRRKAGYYISLLTRNNSGLPPRYYIPPHDVREEVLVPSDRHTRCPYKGVASYWSGRRFSPGSLSP